MAKLVKGVVSVAAFCFVVLSVKPIPVGSEELETVPVAVYEQPETTLPEEEVAVEVIPVEQEETILVIPQNAAEAEELSALAEEEEGEEEREAAIARQSSVKEQVLAKQKEQKKESVPAEKKVSAPAKTTPATTPEEPAPSNEATGSGAGQGGNFSLTVDGEEMMFDLIIIN